MSDLAAVSPEVGQAVVPPAAASSFLRSRSIVSVPMLVMLAALTLLGALAREPLAIMLGTSVFVIILLARLWTQAALIDVRYVAAASRDRLLIGEEFELSMVIENRKVLPVPWLRLAEYVPKGIDVLGPTSMFSGVPDCLKLETTVRMAGHERIRLPRRLKAVRRGIYRFGPARLLASDLFGFYEATGGVPCRSREVVVYPRIVPIGHFPLPPARPMGDDRSKRPLITDPTRPAGVREYSSGDWLRDIDWKVTAKHGELFVRTYEASVTGHVVIVLECSRTAGATLVARATMLEDGVSAAASLAAHFSGEGYGVGLVSNGAAPDADGPAIIPPARGPHQLAALLTCLAGVGEIAAYPLEEVVRTHGSEALPFGCTIIYVTARVHADSVECLKSFRTMGCALTVAYAGRGEPPDTGDVGLVDLRTVPGLLASNDSGGG